MTYNYLDHNAHFIYRECLICNHDYDGINKQRRRNNDQHFRISLN